jgi:UDP-glucuronate decarboxylase
MHPNDGRVVSNFIVHALQGIPVTVYGDGSQTRSFCYVDDTVDGLVRMMESPDHVTGPINIGNPNEMTVRELAEKVVAMVGSSAKLEYRDLPSDDPRQRQPDITRARELLGWEPRVPLEQGLAQTIRFFRELAESDQLPPAQAAE